ncbi:MAG TPA: bifunctional DedA family/phosphatase PAP2 family protein [Thermoleophilaceae bacterium]|nr:bifunctional DedA family/phosphatase PAP2 family protein [Thermoleophilaceae bacterium]
MKPSHVIALVAAALLLAGALWRRKRLGGERFVIALLVVAGLAVYGSGLLSHVNIQKGIEDLAKALGKWTYALVGVMAFAETGAFIGLVAPGEFTVILGGVIAGQGAINIFILIGIVWACTLSGDTVSFFLGRRLGRAFLEKHGPKLRITPERLAQVDEHFKRRGGATVLVGRFIGFVRPIAPFLAGSSQMEYRRFLPYSVLGTGLWGPGFCLLGYVFWQSFDQVTKIAGRATLIFGAIVAVLVAIWYVRRRLKDPEEKARVVAWLERQGERPLLRPLAAAIRAAAPRARFLVERLTPGALGLEFTTALAIAAVGIYVFVAYAVTLGNDPRLLTPADSSLLKLADRTKVTGLVDAVKVYTDVGALPTVSALMAVAAVGLAMRRRPVEFAALVGGFVLLIIAVALVKAGVDRPRPPGKLVSTHGAGFPSGHTAYSTAYVAMAVVASRVLPGFGRRALLVLGTVIVSVTIGLSRMYLRAHYWSDVAGGWALGAAIFGLCAVIALVVSHMRNTAPARS